MKMGRNSEAAGAFSRAEQICEKPEDKSRLAYLQANAYLAEGNFADAAFGFARSASYGGPDADRALYAQADAIERAGSDDPEAITKALAETKNFATPLGALSINATHDAELPVGIIQYKDGKRAYIGEAVAE